MIEWYGLWTFLTLEIFRKYGITGPHIRPSQWSQKAIFAAKLAIVLQNWLVLLWNRTGYFHGKIGHFHFETVYFCSEIDQFGCEIDQFWCEIGHFFLQIDPKILEKHRFRENVFFLLKKYCNKLDYFQWHFKIDRKWSKIIKLLCRIWEVYF